MISLVAASEHGNKMYLLDKGGKAMFWYPKQLVAEGVETASPVYGMNITRIISFY